MKKSDVDKIRKGWTKKLSRDDLHHIRVDAGCRSLDAFVSTIKWQKEQGIECQECETISHKLGINI